jgi:hypothetical protein
MFDSVTDRSELKIFYFPNLVDVLRVMKVLPVLLVRDTYLSRISDPASKGFLDPGSASASKNLVFNPKKFFDALGNTV